MYILKFISLYIQVIFAESLSISMSDNRVLAVSFDVMDCGKRVSDSKKKFNWKFKIGSESYTLSLVSSALTGKRKIYLNECEIYSEQNVLNYNFDYNHNIEGHNIRIFKGESVNSYDVRIDNRSFDYLLRKKTTNNQPEVKKTSQFAAKQEDPFSDFVNITKKADKNQEVKNNNEFGEFDDFDFGSKPAQKKQAQKKDLQFFDFDGEKKNQPLISAENFETNNISNMQKNLCANQDLLSGDFSTNAYGFNNNYLDLIDSKGDHSDTYGKEPQKKTAFDEIKCDMTGKQLMNKTKMTAEMVKNKAADLIDSLI